MSFPQARCCCSRSMRRVDVEVLEHIVPVLVLLDIGDCLTHRRLPLWVFMQCVLYGGVLLFNGRQAIVEAVVVHLFTMIALAREWHTSSLVAIRNFFIGLLLIVVEVAILPFLTWDLLPGALSMLRSGLLPASMLGLVYAGRSRLIPIYIAGESRYLRDWVIAVVPGLQVASYSRRSTSARCCLLHL